MGFLSKLGAGSSSEVHIDCGDSLDISKASEFRDQLKKALGKGGEVVLDASELARIDAASLQLCAAFFADAASRKVAAKWQSPSETLMTSAGLLGLSEQLGLPK